MNEQLMERIAQAGNVGADTATPEEQPVSQDPATTLWNLLEQDYYGTLQLMAQQAGYQLVPTGGQPTTAPTGPATPAVPQATPMMQQPVATGSPPMEQWQRLAAEAWLAVQFNKAADLVQKLAEQDGLEISDKELEQIFQDGLMRFGGDMEAAYARYALPRIRSKQNQPKQEQEKDIEASDLLAAIKQAGYR